MQVRRRPVPGEARVDKGLGQLHVEGAVVVDADRMGGGAHVELQPLPATPQIRRRQINTGRGAALVHLRADVALQPAHLRTLKGDIVVVRRIGRHVDDGVNGLEGAVFQEQIPGLSRALKELLHVGHIRTEVIQRPVDVVVFGARQSGQGDFGNAGLETGWLG